jgi:hypothetical protein
MTVTKRERVLNTATQELKKLLNDNISCGWQPKNQKRSENFLHHLGHHTELGQEATSIKHMPLLNTSSTSTSLRE